LTTTARDKQLKLRGKVGTEDIQLQVTRSNGSKKQIRELVTKMVTDPSMHRKVFVCSLA
jgi:hypothetical protein